tara:strand:+ start:2244 stop:2411 length:168 start_codon:yes stop_codon:yes gene_type:complete
MKYKLFKDTYTGIVESVQKTENGYICIIPFDKANSDYQEYLKWKAIDGNEPEAAD